MKQENMKPKREAQQKYGKYRMRLDWLRFLNNQK